MTNLIRTLPNGKWRQNCYFVFDDNSRLSLIIDPGSDAPFIQGELSKLELTPIAIVNTHAHYDHIGAVASLMDYYKIPFYLNSADAKLMKQANIYKFLFESSESVIIPEATHELATEKAILQLDDFKLSILCTPGHTNGSTCLKIGTDLFSGDTILSSGPGRTDLPGGDKVALAKSLDVLRNLPDETKVWPGHGKSFRLGCLWKKLDQEEGNN